MTRKTVAILYASGDENLPDFQDTFIQVTEISQQLEGLGYLVQKKDFSSPREDLLAYIHTENPDVVFNVVEAVDGNERDYYRAAEWLEATGCAFTGNNSRNLYLSVNKVLLKRQLVSAGIATPEYFTIGSNPPPDTSFIVKPSDAHGSKGIDDRSVVSSIKAANLLMTEKADLYGGSWFAEEYIEGREINIALVEVDNGFMFLPATETIFENLSPGSPHIVCYKAKWDEASDEYRNTPIGYLDDGDDPLNNRLRDVSSKVWHFLNLRGIVRLDFRVDSNGKAWLIDLNPSPSLRSNSYVVAAAKKAGLSQGDIVNFMVLSAARKTCSPAAA